MLNMFKPLELRTNSDNIKLGTIFAWIGGYVNGVAILLLGNTIAHMSGNLANLGKNIGMMDWQAFVIIFFIVVCFVMGAASGNYFFQRYSYRHVLVSEAFLLMLMGDVRFKLAVIIGALAMGLQNAVTSCLTKNVVRTSHLTSTSTDIGIALARKDTKDYALKTILAGSYLWGACLGVFGAELWGVSAFSFAGVVVMCVLAADALSTARDDDFLGVLYKRVACKVLDL